MRLIDADKLYKALAKPSDLPGDTIGVLEVRIAILAAPEVKAIPKEWIKEYAERGSSYFLYAEETEATIKTMLEDWEKENGTEETGQH